MSYTTPQRVRVVNGLPSGASAQLNVCHPGGVCKSNGAFVFGRFPYMKCDVIFIVTWPTSYDHGIQMGFQVEERINAMENDVGELKNLLKGSQLKVKKLTTNFTDQCLKMEKMKNDIDQKTQFLQDTMNDLKTQEAACLHTIADLTEDVEKLKEDMSEMKEDMSEMKLFKFRIEALNPELYVETEATDFICRISCRDRLHE